MGIEVSGSTDGFDTREFRNALGMFATGVTIVTTRGAEGEPVGMAVSSFNSVSLDPPLILWSLGLESSSFDAFEAARHFAVHVLTAEQQALSDRFAAKDVDRFAGLNLDEGVGGVPLLRDYAARFECSTEVRHPGGDHIIIIGRVHRYAYAPRPPLLFHGGRYGRIAEGAG